MWEEVIDMRTQEIKCYTVAETFIYGETLIQAKWYGGSGVNVYVDGKQVDIFTNRFMKTSDDLVEAFAEYLAYQESLTNEV